MSLIALTLLLAAAAQTPQVPVRQIATVSVEIVAAEEIRFADFAKPQTRHSRQTKATQTQKRMRDAMPMLEFY